MGLVGQLLRRLTWRLALLWLVIIGGIWLFVEFADEVYEGNGLPGDEAVLIWFEQLQTPLLTEIMYTLSVIGDVPATLALSVVVLIMLGVWLRREILFFLVSMGGASLIMGVTKYVLARPRPELFPDNVLYVTASPSFPSGHATGSAAFYLTLYLIARRHAPRWSWLVGLLGAALTLSITASRLYLQVHYPSDVLAGLALGTAWVLGVRTIFHRERDHQFLLLRLPREVADDVHHEAAEQARTEDEVVTEILAEELGEEEHEDGVTGRTR